MIHTDQFLTKEECEELLGAPRCFQFGRLAKRGLAPEYRLVREAAVDAPWFDAKLNRYVNEVIAPLYAVHAPWHLTTSYLEYLPGFYFKRHSDFIQNAPRRRLVSMSIGLDADYTGGELVLYGDPEVRYSSKTGSLIAFPSNLMHEVLPIKTGVRHAIVVWVAVPKSDHT